jgi:hypothetical protein
MKVMPKIMICAIGLSLVMTGCAYFRPPEPDPAFLEQQQKERERLISQDEKDLADLISQEWMRLNSSKR